MQQACLINKDHPNRNPLESEHHKQSNGPEGWGSVGGEDTSHPHPLIPFTACPVVFIVSITKIELGHRVQTAWRSSRNPVGV